MINRTSVVILGFVISFLVPSASGQILGRRQPSQVYTPPPMGGPPSSFPAVQPPSPKQVVPPLNEMRIYRAVRSVPSFSITVDITKNITHLYITNIVTGRATIVDLTGCPALITRTEEGWSYLTYYASIVPGTPPSFLVLGMPTYMIRRGATLELREDIDDPPVSFRIVHVVGGGTAQMLAYDPK